MIEVIKEIISIEKKAQDIIENTHQERNQKVSEMNNRLDLLEKETKSKAIRKIKQIRERELNEVREKAELLMNETNDKVAAMESLASQNKTIWVEQLVEAVLKR